MKRYYYWIVSFCLLAACKKTDVTPGNGQEAYVNFYNASEVLQQNMSFSMNNQIIINDSLPGQVQPEFSPTDDFRQFPRHLTGSAVIDAVYPPAGLTYDVVYWMALTSNQYRFRYTSVNKTAITDTAVNLQPKSFTAQYLVESPQAENAYRMLNVPVERKGVPGKVRLQVINLSPDFGPLEVYRADQDGNRVSSQLPTALATDSYSSYVEVDTTGAAKTYNKILLKFCKSGTSEVVLTKAVDAISNSCYSIVFQGFERSTQRRLKTGNGDFETVTVSPNLRVNIRRTF